MKIWLTILTFIWMTSFVGVGAWLVVAYLRKLLAGEIRLVTFARFLLVSILWGALAFATLFFAMLIGVSTGMIGPKATQGAGHPWIAFAGANLIAILNLWASYRICLWTARVLKLSATPPQTRP